MSINISELDNFITHNLEKLKIQARVDGITQGFGLKEIRDVEDMGKKIAQQPNLTWTDRRSISDKVQSFIFSVDNLYTSSNISH